MGSDDFNLTNSSWFDVILSEGAVTSTAVGTSDLFNNESVGGNAKRVTLRRYCKKCEDKKRCHCG
jgi:hypothetical protein|tara:strand:- start:15636 stop:15830 length:195 start_codon:yes stop_codon:yes gene_type:complete